ncbi:hypothetical protein PSM36_0588 [Proteiniphilum saccharofermentans]|uniref:Uncharacterized protein n=2 Tax=Proteiniphilum saccharofermentans TaxID=1642647 RepID=A0A1R3T2K3_9BACT|nr:hypothetical protein PSM36_0588 [Proteiniphilum saccharofermentans]SFK32907.1 hypothetical protein SAMN05216357_101329 [Porphyromonadaceae bacterium KH3CP3RA]SFS30229.1 hypothetical protein SAMN05216365_101133 [Porphyromonadaceae bacterium NLAE-zl-C104]
MVVYFLLKAVAAFLMGKRGRQTSNFRQQRAQQDKQPENQQDRIIEYQKKKFESSEIEDADFVEVKDSRKI